MPRSITIPLVTACALVLGACAGMRIDTDYDPEVAFGDFRTYAWLDSAEVAEDLAERSPFLERRIRRSVDKVLQERGYAYLPGVDADFHVTAFVVVPDRTGDAQRPVPRWDAPLVSVHFGVIYPYAYGIGYPWHRYRYPYYRYPWGYASAYRVGFGYMWVPVYERPSGHLPGTVVIDVFDCRTDELVWRGWAEGALTDLRDRDETQAYLDEVVAKVLAEFPPATR
jgi:hypothetical protein